MQTPLCVHDVKSRSHAVACAWRIIIDSRCFMCNRCDSTTQEADLTEDLVVDGETFGCVKQCLPALLSHRVSNNIPITVTNHYHKDTVIGIQQLGKYTTSHLTRDNIHDNTKQQWTQYRRLMHNNFQTYRYYIYQ